MSGSSRCGTSEEESVRLKWRKSRRPRKQFYESTCSSRSKTLATVARSQRKWARFVQWPRPSSRLASGASAALLYYAPVLLTLGLLAGAAREIPEQAPVVTADKAQLEAELNSLLQQQYDGDSGSKHLSDAIISRLMLSNLSEPGELASAPELLAGQSLDESPNLVLVEGSGAANEDEQQQAAGQLSGPELLRLQKLMSYLQKFGLAQAAASSGLNGDQALSQYPVLPAGQASTIKRAGAKMGAYSKQQAAYGTKNSFDFGLGKRPDSSVSGGILRFGDSVLGSNGHVASLGLGKRPSAHRYDFGLGKRVASSVYPRYDFGLGKRAPNRIRYDFGLGK